jgi:hypothetical protein
MTPKAPLPFVLLQCADCEHTFPSRLPPWGIELPACPLCESGPVRLVELLEPDSLRH